MSSHEQKIEVSYPSSHLANKLQPQWIFAAEPYETIAFCLPNEEMEKDVGPLVTGESKFWKWEEDTKTFSLQLHFKPKEHCLIIGGINSCKMWFLMKVIT